MTPKQRDVLLFVRAHQAQHDGISPSFQEIGDGLGIKTKSEVFRRLRGLEEAGLIERRRNRARAIKIVGTVSALGGVPSEALIGELIRRGEWPGVAAR